MDSKKLFVTNASSSCRGTFRLPQRRICSHCERISHGRAVHLRSVNRLTRGKDYQPLLLRRSMKVLTHETGHIFGLAHCVYFACVMNGSNH